MALNGTKMYLSSDEIADERIDEYDLGTAWSLSDVTYVQSYSMPNPPSDNAPRGVFLKHDGTKMFWLGNENDTLYEFDLSTPWDISTASYASSDFDVSNEGFNPDDVHFRPDGSQFFIVDQASEDINNYDLGTDWDASTASNNGTLSVSGRDQFPQGVYIRPDGSQLFMCGADNDSVYEYDLSTNWDITSASFSQSEFVTGQPRNLFFSDDGTKMFYVDDQNDRIREYLLSTSWDISTASLNESFNYGGNSNNVQGLFFGGPATDTFIPRVTSIM